MHELITYNWQDIQTIVIDFDGVFTDNSVYVQEDGTELVKCSRADGLGLNLLRNYSTAIKWELDILILSTEKNRVVTKRAEKMGIKCFQAIKNKRKFIRKYRSDSKEHNKDGKILYIGNDLNDYEAMLECDLIFCPRDSHQLIRQIAHHVIPVDGGDGVIRELVETILPNSPELLLSYLNS